MSDVVMCGEDEIVGKVVKGFYDDGDRIWLSFEDGTVCGWQGWADGPGENDIYFESPRNPPDADVLYFLDLIDGEECKRRKQAERDAEQQKTEAEERAEFERLAAKFGATSLPPAP